MTISLTGNMTTGIASMLAPNATFATLGSSAFVYPQFEYDSVGMKTGSAYLLSQLDTYSDTYIVSFQPDLMKEIANAHLLLRATRFVNTTKPQADRKEGNFDDIIKELGKLLPLSSGKTPETKLAEVERLLRDIIGINSYESKIREMWRQIPGRAMAIHLRAAYVRIIDERLIDLICFTGARPTQILFELVEMAKIVGCPHLDKIIDTVVNFACSHGYDPDFPHLGQFDEPTDVPYALEQIEYARMDLDPNDTPLERAKKHKQRLAELVRKCNAARGARREFERQQLFGTPQQRATKASLANRRNCALMLADLMRENRRELAEAAEKHPKAFSKALAWQSLKGPKKFN
ncbi:MAG: hypothetical protein ABH871_08270 [Pseudomonadota bacterium]